MDWISLGGEGPRPRPADATRGKYGQMVVSTAKW